MLKDKIINLIQEKREGVTGILKQNIIKIKQNYYMILFVYRITC